MINQSDLDRKIEDLSYSVNNLTNFNTIQSDRSLKLMLETCEMIGEINDRVKGMLEELVEEK